MKLKHKLPAYMTVLCLMALFFSCAAGEGLTGSGVQAADNDDAPRYYMRQPSRDGVDGFLSIIGEIRGDGLLSGADFSPETCYNVTPARVAAETDIRIFQYGDTSASFALVDGEVYEICRWFGGNGFFDAFPWDYDGDGQTDLLIASSWGSGLHRAELSVFNRATKEITVIHDTTEDGLCYRGLYDLCFDGAAAWGPNEGGRIAAVNVDCVELVITGNDDEPCCFVNRGHYGTVCLEMGVPVFRGDP